MTATLTDNARTILEKRYLSGGESIDGLWDRVSGGNPRFRRLMSELRGMPNSPTLFNLGLGNGCTSSACFVFSFSDSMLDGPRSILNTRNKAAAVAKAGGGVGYYGGHLRERGALIKSVHRKACGPVAVLRDMHGLRSLITQGGKRDLAQMFVLPVWHKDVREFIHCKDSDPKALESFNTSAAWPNEWVDKVQWDKKLLDAATGDCNDETSLWWEQCASAWQTGCPGMFFPDRVNRDNHNMHLGLIEAPNPCGETPNRDSEPCNLLSLRLSAYFLSGNRSIDWKALEEDAWTATEFLDDILDRNTFPHPDITKAALLTRKLGLGVMDWASLLAMMHVHYDSEEAIALAGKVMGFIQEVSYACSEKMGKEKGPYLGYSSTLTQAPMRRNETNLSVAPTGTIAIITGCKSWSIEPHYGLDVERVTNEGIRMEEKVTADLYDGFVPHVASEIGLEWHVRMQAAYQRHVDLGTSKTINLPNSATVEDVSQAYRMMWDLECKGGTIFRDGCRSEQVLRKKDAPSVYALGGLVPKDGLPTGKHPLGVSPALEAFSLGEEPRKIEGRGVMEPGIQAPAEQPDGEEDMSQRFHPSPPPVKRHKPPMTRPGFIHKIDIGQFEGYLTVGTYEDGTPAEIFLEASMEGSTVSGLMDAWAKSVSVALQHGCPLETLVRLHCGMRFEPSGMTKNEELPVCSSVADYVFRWMASQFLGKKLNPVPRDATTRAKVMSAVAMGTGGDSGVFCPECGAQCIYGAGCLVCSNKECSWSRCG